MIRTDINEQTGIIWFDDPPLNMLSAEDASDIARALDRLEGAVQVVILIGANRTFCAGEVLDRDSHADWERVLRRLRAFPVTTVAAISGSCLGLGLELALACDGRLASLNARMGLPEITLELIPRADTILDLARRLGPSRALEFIASGAVVDGYRAQRLGLADGELALSPLADGWALAERLEFQKRSRIIEAAIPLDAGFDQQVAHSLKQGNDALAIHALVDILRRADEELDHARTHAIKRRQELIDGFASRALIHLAHCERTARRTIRTPPPRLLDSALLYGSGIALASLAYCLARAGISVTIVDRGAEAMSGFHNLLSFDAANNLIDDATARTLLRRVTAADGKVSPQAYSLIMSADERPPPEDVRTSTDAIFSYAAEEPTEDNLALRLLPPFHISSIAELPEREPDELYATGIDLCRRIAKIPLPVRGGFMSDIITHGIGATMADLVAAGAAPASIDETLGTVGFRVRLCSLIEFQRYDARWSNHPLLVSLRRLGVDWTSDSGLSALRREYPADDATAPSEAQVVQATMAAFLWVSVRAVSARVASGDSIDLMMVHGFGFPSRLGGPVFAARSGTLETAQALLDAEGYRVPTEDVQSLFEESAPQGGE